VDGLSGRRRRPIIPAWLRSWPAFRSTFLVVSGFYVHAAGFHLLRTPLYAVVLALRSPLGALRLARTLVGWALDREGHPLRLAAVRDTRPDEYVTLSKQRDRRVKVRLVLLALWSFLSVFGCVTVVLACPVWARWAILAATVACAGRYGTPKDKPVIGRAVVEARYVKLTSDAVVTALTSLGIGAVKDGAAIGFPSPITRDGAGWRADIDLPPGVTAAEVIERRPKLAAALSRPLGCVWPEPAPEVHPGRLVLWVADRDMSRTTPPAWPLAKSGTADVFAFMPIGVDPRGRAVAVTLMFASMIIGALPRMGKTFALRLILLIAALDPRVEIHAYDLKGMGDLAPLEPVAHRYRAGVEDDDFLYMLTDFRELSTELDRRAKTIRGLPRDLCPENKITPPLASNRSLKLHPVMVGVDECQKLFEHPEYGKEFEALCEDLVRRGPAAGIMLLLATQRPDSKSIPTSISANAVLRLCLKVIGQTENDMILGTSAYRNGLRATTFSFQDKGIGYLVGASDEPVVLRAAFLDGPAAEAVARRARVIREQQDRLTGYAAGRDTTSEQHAGQRRPTLVADLATVFHPSETKQWSETLVDRLAELRPEVYGPWGELPTGAVKASQLSAALKPCGVTTAQVWGTDPATGQGANRRGVVYADIDAARHRLAHREP
jgi:S-DNA-T family DNA segregation ATPase FtsK/SpoIIIE